MAIPISVPKAYEEIIEFIAAGTSPSNIIAFQPSQASKDRVADLIFREKNEGLTLEEQQELDLYMQLEHLMRLAKVHARKHLTHQLPNL
jgi:hypothetical protein